MAKSKKDKEFDIFISYNWDVKTKVIKLYKTLTEKYDFRVWMDEYEMGSTRLNDELATAIMNSKLFISCITQKYCESKNCKNELEYAESNNKKIVVLMFERLAIKDIGGVGFMIGPMVRYNCYKTPDIFEHWNGNIFESFMQAVMGYLNRSIDFDQYDSKKDTISADINCNVVAKMPNKDLVPYIQNEQNSLPFSSISIQPKKKITSIVCKNVNIMPSNDTPSLSASKEKCKTEQEPPTTTQYTESNKESTKVQIIKPQTKCISDEKKNSTEVISDARNICSISDLKLNEIKVEIANKPIGAPVPEIATGYLDRDSLAEYGCQKTDVQMLFKSKKISSLDPFTFRGLGHVEGIYLNDNLLTDIENGSFSGVRNVITISLEFNSINQIQVGLFNTLSSLQYLKLNCNQIKSIDGSAFDGLRNLKSLDLSENLLKNVDKSTFKELKSLISLYLNANLIKQLDVMTFNGLVNLETLDLHRNYVKKFEVGTFKGLTSLKYLDILDNPLDSFDGGLEEFDNVEVSV